MIARVGLAALTVAVCAVVGNAATSVIRERQAAVAAPRATAATPAEPASRAGSGAPMYAATGASPAAAPRGDRTPAQPRIAEGRTELRDSMFAVRAGNTVAVHFDTELMRTRRAEKFEQIVRSTLPAIYGALADSALAAVPPGKLVGAADLLTKLPTTGLQLRAANGVTLTVWPETRPGRDGPLVIAYRASVVR